ncbi:Retrovirus-related Pol polyprotein from type-1 retrotransposable element R1, partial [Stegodyphus mimosarum]
MFSNTSQNDRTADFEELSSKIISEILDLRSDGSLNDDEIVEFNNENYLVQCGEAEGLFTKYEIKAAIDRLRNKSAPGLDNIKALLLKVMFGHFTDFYILLYNKCFELSFFPETWKIGRIILLPKDEGKFRPICPLKTHAKVLDILISNRFNHYVTKNDILSHCQFGFSTGRSADDALFEFIEFIKKERGSGCNCT